MSATEKQFDPNEPLFIVAGGTSLANFDWSRLDGRQVLAINRAYRKTKPKYVYWTDGKFFIEHKAELLRLDLSVELHAAVDTVYEVWYSNYSRIHTWGLDRLAGWSPVYGCIAHGNNSGFAAIQLAVKRGHRNLVLMGYDFYLSEDGKDHWHEGYTEKLRERTLTEKMLPYFQTMVDPLAKLGVTIVNANPNSRLNCWPKVELW